MTNFDMTPLYRSTIGYDRLANLFDALGAPEKTAAYPPYDVARTGETDYRISMAWSKRGAKSRPATHPISKIQGGPKWTSFVNL